MKKLLLGLAAGAVALSVPTMAMAEDAGPNTGAFSFSGGATYVTSYMFRGYNNGDSGKIIQPYLQLNTESMKADTVTFSPYIGTWNSFQDADASGKLDNYWYESDIYGGVDIAFGEFKITPSYTFYTYPAGDTTQEFGLKLAYDDTEAMKNAGVPFALAPYIYYALETDHPGGDENQYLEVGVAPSFELSKDSAVTISVPVVLGMSLDGYYTDADGGNSTFGWGSIGVTASMPLSSIPAKYGSWSLTGGVTYVQLFADSAQASNGDDDWRVVGSVGLGFTY